MFHSYLIKYLDKDGKPHECIEDGMAITDILYDYLFMDKKVVGYNEVES